MGKSWGGPRPCWDMLAFILQQRGEGQIMVVLCSLLSSSLHLSERILDILGSGPLLVDAFTAADVICNVSTHCCHCCAVDS